MAKLNIKIQKQNRYDETETIVDIDLNNGHWKYWDDYMERTQDDKISLTMNTIREAHYMGLPVKDAYGICDTELAREKHEYKIVDAMVRPFDTLHKYLCCAIKWAKEDFNSNVCDIMGYKEKGRKYTAVLFDESYVRSNDRDIVEDMVYTDGILITVKINWIEFDLINVRIVKYPSGFCEMFVDGEIEAFCQKENEVVNMIECWLDDSGLADEDIVVEGFDDYYED